LTLLTDEELDARLGAVDTNPYTYIRPFSTAAEDLIEVVQNADGRWMFGIPEIDMMIRGLGRGELMYVTGEAHSGKTQLVLQSIVNNPGARVLFFTPDEVDSLILTKLIGIKYGVNGEDLERLLKLGNEAHLELVRNAAAVDFSNLVVVDESLTFEQMSVAVAEATLMWDGQPPDVVIVDFLELLPGAGDASNDSVQWKSMELKRWTKIEDVPMICVHQASRSSGKRGQSRGMRAMRYGGENDAIFVLEVYRKSEDEDLEEIERDRLRNTITVNVCKNKRPPSRKGQKDLYLDAQCGLVRSLLPTDMIIQRGAAKVLDIQGAARHGMGQGEGVLDSQGNEGTL
jgi:replicative DNA helicase